MSEYEKRLADLTLKKGEVLGIGKQEETILEYKLLEFMERMNTPLSVSKVREIIKYNNYLNDNPLLSEYILNEERFKNFRKRILNSNLFTPLKVYTDKGGEMAGVKINEKYYKIYKDIIEINLLPVIFQTYDSKNKNVYQLLDSIFQKNEEKYTEFEIISYGNVDIVLDFIVLLCKEYDELKKVTYRTSFARHNIVENLMQQNKEYIQYSQIPSKLTENENNQMDTTPTLEQEHPTELNEIPSLKEFLKYVKDNRDNYLGMSDEEKYKHVMSLDGELFEFYKVLIHIK